MEELHQEDYDQIEQDNLDYARCCWFAFWIAGALYLAYKGFYCVFWH